MVKSDEERRRQVARLHHMYSITMRLSLFSKVEAGPFGNKVPKVLGRKGEVSTILIIPTILTKLSRLLVNDRHSGYNLGGVILNFRLNKCC